METRESLKILIRTTSRWLRVLFPLITIILLIVIFNMVTGFESIGIIVSTLAPFVFSFLLAWILSPAVKKLSEMLKVPRWASTLIVLTFLILCTVGIFLIIVPEMVFQIKELIKQIPSIENGILELINYLEPKFGGKVDFSVLDNAIEDMSQILETVLSGSLDIITSSITFVGEIVASLITGLMVVTAGVYLLLDFEGISKKLYGLVPKRFKGDFNLLSRDINRVIVGYLRGLIIETIIICILSYISFSILFSIYDLRGALVFAFIIGITNIIPYIGPFIGAVPVGIFALAVSFKLAVITCLIVLVIQQIDGIIIKPKVFGKTTDVHPAISIISVILFAKLYGFFGIIFAIPIAGLFIIIIKFVYSKLMIRYPEILK